MALRGALKDRGRILRKEADAKRVDGRTVFNPVSKPLFRCRLEVNDAPESEDQGGVMSTDQEPGLLTDRKDVEHEVLFFQPDDEIEVESRDLAETEERGWHVVGTFKVNGEPKPIRKKRKVIGYQLRLKRVSESPMVRSRV